MSKVMNKRVYGLIGISSIMANWNADFTGRPKSTSDGNVFGSDKALKYSIKKYLKDKGEKILYIKTYKIDEKGKADEKDKLQPKELTERYNEIFAPAVLTKKTSSKEVLKNLFSVVDVMNFGATFAVEDQNISITGAVQIGQGFNIYENTTTEVQDILSPFRNSKKDDADASSLGKKIMSNEAHYIYPFSINPNNYFEYINIVEGFDGYTAQAYEFFKEGALVGATALNTNSKSGCENEFALFIEIKEGSEIYFPNLDRYVEFQKAEGKNIIDITKIGELINKFRDDIEDISIYYNPYTTLVKHEFKDAAIMNIFTKEKI
ncbi:type I CRISPR-associated protein Cas7 [Proteiniborus sp.]|uniref:type I CRISPR-associated protein Cas7 n=1 Tax=Proteiniborus sp. TaxID=2079015 RepID=UPI0033183E37